MRVVKITLFALAGLLLTAVVFLVVDDRLNQPPPPNWATLIQKARQYDVRIKRDTFGVPHVIGPRDADVGFGLGFAQSEDDFLTLQQVTLAARCQLSPTECRKAAEDAFLITHEPIPVGSNAVAVGPSRSADGATRLLVNSHQPYTGPVSWYEAVLESGQGWHVAGGFFPGSPFMLHGHNEHLGWANTVNEPDLIDVYKLTINPANSNQYQLDGQWHDFEKSDAKIRVKIWGPLVWTVHREVLYAAQGPVLKTDHGVFAIRYAGVNEVRQPLEYYRLNKAATLAEWRAAMALQAIPSINFVYADEKANIGYVYNGLFPVRQEGLDWQDVLPGDRSDLIWHRYLPFDKIPQIWNPRGGLVFNSNNTPFHAAAPPDGLRPQDFSPTLRIQNNMTNRAWRSMENYRADSRITNSAFRAYTFDLTHTTHSDGA